MKKLLVISVICAVVGIAGVASAEVLRVPDDYPTLDEAFAASSAGDTVMQTEPGYYRDEDSYHLNIPEDRVLTIDYESGLIPGDCVLKDKYGSRVVFMEDGSTLDGFCVLPTSSTLVRARSHTVIRNVVLIADHTTSGALYFSHADEVLIEHVTIYGDGEATTGIWLVVGSSVIRDTMVVGFSQPIGAISYHEGDWDYILTNKKEFYYDQWCDITLGDHIIFKGHANLNECYVPFPPSDAIGNGSAGDEIGALSFDMDPETTDFSLSLLDDFLVPGDTFDIKLVWNHELCGGLTVDMFTILDAYGIYYFWPSWCLDCVDYETLFVAEDGWERQVIDPFTWPDVSGHGEACFWGAAFATGVTPSLDTLLTPIACETFAW